MIFAVVRTYARSGMIADLYGSTWQIAWRNVVFLASLRLVSTGLLVSGTPSQWTFTVPATCQRKKAIDKMAECDMCKTWYHQHCMDIPDNVFDD